MRTLSETPKIVNLLIFICLFVFFGCASDEVIILDEEEPVVLIPDFSNDSERLTNVEYDFILKLLKIDADMQTTFEGFNLIREMPAFIVTGPNQGIFINPPESELALARKITDTIPGYEQLNLYRYSDLVPYTQARTTMNFFYNPWDTYHGYRIYLYNITYGVGDHFYAQYKNKNGHYLASIYVHELFHVYQFDYVANQWFDPNAIQDIDGYPVNEDTLPYLILYFNMMKDAYNQDYTLHQKFELLAYYLSINSKLLDLDTTEFNLVRNHGFSQEKTEGVARYIEVFGTLNTLDNDLSEDPTHGYGDFIDSIDNIEEAFGIYNLRMFYHTGAGAIHLLKELNYPNIEQDLLIPENTPYDLANSLIQLNTQQKETFLQQAKERYDWQAILARADALLN